METFEKELLNRYKIWQELFKENSDDNKDTNKNYLICNSSFSGCSGGCKGCGCHGCND